MMVWETLLELTYVGVPPVRSPEDTTPIALTILEKTHVSAGFKRFLADALLVISDPLATVLRVTFYFDAVAAPRSILELPNVGRPSKPVYQLPKAMLEPVLKLACVRAQIFANSVAQLAIPMVLAIDELAHVDPVDLLRAF